MPFAAATLGAGAIRSAIRTRWAAGAPTFPTMLRAAAIVHAALLGELLLAPFAAPMRASADLADAAGAQSVSLLLAVTGLLLCLLALSIRRDRAVPPARSQALSAMARGPLRGEAVIAPPGAPLEGWSTLMQRVSHELRTPLNAVIGFSDVMQRELLGPLGHARYVEYAEHIRQCGGDLLKATEDTLALTSLVSRGGVIERRALPLAGLVQAAHCIAAARHGEPAAAVRIEVDRDREVLGDQRALQQALVNVLAAAMKRVAEGTCVRVSASSAGDHMHLIVQVDDVRPNAAADDLELCVARTLLALAGHSLTEAADGGSGWRATIALDAATQDDLFEK